MKGKLNRILNKKISGMELTEFNLNLFLAMAIVEGIGILPVFVMVGTIGKLVAPVLVLTLGCAMLLYMNIRYRMHNLTAILTLIILDGIAIPMILRFGNVAYCVAVMWFVSSMIIIYSVFEGLIFPFVLVMFTFEYC